MFTHCHYVPCLRWKQGEYKAVDLLSASARQIITPLIEVPEKGFDFETRTDKKTIDDHLAPFPKRVASFWKKKTCFVDLSLIASAERMSRGVHPVTHVFQELSARGCSAIPVTGLSRDRHYHRAAVQAAMDGKRGLCLRITVEEAVRPSLQSSINALLDGEFKPEECDLIFDLKAPNYFPIHGFAKALEPLIKRFPDLNRWRTFTLIGTSFPGHMGEIKTTSATIPRNEWILYKTIAKTLSNAGDRIPSFGDYTINHPNMLPKDMRLLKPSATIRYATDDAWLIVKGRNVRDHAYGQYRSLAKSVIADSLFLGATFSKGAEYIRDCANGNESTGNLSTWRWVGTNQHLEKVARDLANFFAS